MRRTPRYAWIRWAVAGLAGLVAVADLVMVYLLARRILVHDLCYDLHVGSLTRCLHVGAEMADQPHYLCIEHYCGTLLTILSSAAEGLILLVIVSLWVLSLRGRPLDAVARSSSVFWLGIGGIGFTRFFCRGTAIDAVVVWPLIAVMFVSCSLGGLIAATAWIRARWKGSETNAGKTALTCAANAVASAGYLAVTVGIGTLCI